MSRNHPGQEVDPSEGGLEDSSNTGEAASGEAEQQVDPSEDPQ